MIPLRMLLLLSTGLLATAADWQSLVLAEQQFAQLSLSQGTRAAFLANLDEDSILFRPVAVPGKAWMEASPPAASQLNWAPEFADISASGDLGYTTGPWDLKRMPGQPAVAFGHYVTVWKRQPAGWKIALDLGIGHAQVPRPAKVASPKFEGKAGKQATAAQIEAAKRAISEGERTFTSGMTAALALYADDVRFYRDEHLPEVGLKTLRQKAATVYASNWTGSKLNPAAIHVSASGDLAYVYGTVETPTATPETAPVNYLRIWKLQKNGTWKIVLDLVA